MTRRFLPRITREQRRGALVVAIGLLLLAVAFTDQVPFLGGSGGRTVVARFAQANQVDTATPVRVHGVDVGRVAALRAGPGNTTDVVMSITTAGVHLHRDASAQIRWRTLLGGSMYIDLAPGSPSAPPLSGVISPVRTETQVDWDQLNNIYPTPTRRAFQQMLAGFSGGLSAPVQEGRTLHVLGPDASVLGQGSDALRGEQIGDLPRLVRTTAATVRALSADTRSLQGLVTGADGTLAVTASHNAALSRAIQLSPPALDSTLQTSNTVNRMLYDLDPLVSQLEPGARELGPATQVMRPMLERMNRVLNDTRPLLRAAPAAVRGLGTMARQGAPLMASLRPLVARLNTNLIPWLGQTDGDTRLRLYQAIGPFFSALDDSLGSYDANGYVYNFNVQVSSGSVLLPCDTGPGGTNVQACAAAKAALSRRMAGGHW